MHEYLTEVLTKVSFDRGLFQKELNKSKRWLTTGEWDQLYAWAAENFEYLLAGSNVTDKKKSVSVC